ncbi:unnamed protein product [Lactuca virosa]|uniref:Uncharacterized protein n=1 Tax=Lactuca virosa TaxID=75947 RepID=A0AAU9PQM5_9ASTR|nr:unnamed protein product [Lactuca virosa]
MRRHLRKCSPQPLTQLSPEAIQLSNTNEDNAELANEGRAKKKLKYVIEDLHLKTDRELMEFIWMNKRNIVLLEQKLPDKARAIKQAIKCYEDEINHRAKPQSPKENSPGVTNIVTVKIEVDDHLVAQYENSGENMTTETHADVNQRTSPHLENGNMPSKVVADDQSVPENKIFDGNKTEEEHEGKLQIVAIHGDENQASEQQHNELIKVSSVLSLLTSPNSYYIPQNNPLDEKTEQAKQSLIQLLKKDFRTLVGSPDEQTLKSCIKILIKNLDKLPKFQARVIETINTQFESACENWSKWDKSIQESIAFEMKEGGNLEVLQEWQEKDVEVESKILKVDADIERLKAELREKDLTREGLVKRKFELFNESKISIGEAKKILEEMVSLQVRSDVAVDNMNDLNTKWERIREKFLV